MTAYVANRLGPTVGGGQSPLGKPAVYVFETVVDHSTTTNASGDTFKLLNLPPGSVVLAAGATKLTGDTAGNSGTYSLGDSGSGTKYINAQSAATAGEITHATTYFVGYASADYLLLTVNTGAVNGKIRVWALIANTNPADTSQKLTFA